MSRSKNCLPRFLDFFVCVLLAASCQSAWAQAAIASGAVRGIVADNSGAVIAGAEVVLTSRAHGGSQTSTSNSAGIFVFPSQPVGLYSIAVMAPGFRTEIVEPVLVEVGQTTSVNRHLQPGARTDSLT